MFIRRAATSVGLFAAFVLPGVGFAEALDRWNEVGRLSSVPVEVGTKFGVAAAIFGDTLIVSGPGAGNDHPVEEGAGFVYVFERSEGGVWEHKQTLQAPDGRDEDSFGAVLSMAGSIIVVGAPGAGEQGEGGIYVFEKDLDGFWNYTDKLLASEGEPGGHLGDSVDLLGHETLVTGAVFAQLVYVFDRGPDGRWTQTQILESSAKTLRFGEHVAISEGTIAVTDPLGGEETTGSLHVYKKDENGTWFEKAVLIPSDVKRDRFGDSVATQGGEIIAVGASHHDSTGAVYVFEQDKLGEWSQTGKLEASDGEGQDRFGDQDLGIHHDTIFAGSWYEGALGTRAGAVYVFERDENGRWNETQKLLASDGGEEGRFGVSLGLDDRRAVIGASGHEAAYVFEFEELP